MRTSLTRGFNWLFLFSLLAGPAVAQSPAAQNGKVENLPALEAKEVPANIRQVLGDNGYRILLDDGSNAAELWFRKDVPSGTKKDSSDILYTQLAESTLVGVLHFVQASTDYRGQAIPAGYYTLRYSLIPNDGNHLGAAPNRDFLLLIPAESESDPNASYKFAELVAMSRKATGTKHPGPLSMVQPEGTGTAAAVSKDDQDHWIFSSGLKLSSGQEMPFALVVKGTAQQ
jgi:hypothetical protein